jgi:glycosyl transferase family 87
VTHATTLLNEALETPHQAPPSRHRQFSAGDMRRPHSWFQAGGWLLTGLLVAAIAGYLVRGTSNPLDFHTYYYAATAEVLGLDPYRIESLWTIAQKSVPPYYYPPVTFALFVPFTRLPMATAAHVWLGLKLAMVASLIVVWKRWFLRDTSVALIVLVAFFGFNGAMLWDLSAGNVSVPEQFLLWTAFACYLHERRLWFVVLVVLASVFKLLPIAFLGLLLVSSNRYRQSYGLTVAGCAAFAAIVLLPGLLGLKWAHGFVPSLPTERPLGEIAPSALGLLETWLGPVQWSAGLWQTGAGFSNLGTHSTDWALGLWVAFIAILLLVSRSWLREVISSRDPALSVAVASLGLALISPRMMVYSYILLDAPALLLVRRFFPRWAQAIAITLVVVQGTFLYLRVMTPLRFPMAPYAVSVVLMNSSFFVALVLWLVLALFARARAGEGPTISLVLCSSNTSLPRRRRPDRL